MCSVALDEAERAVGDLIGQIAVERDTRRVVAHVADVVVVCTGQESEELIEAVGERAEIPSESEVPFADQSRRIAVVLQQGGQRCSRHGKSDCGIGERVGERALDAEPLRVPATDQRRARGAADLTIGVGVGQPNALAREPIAVRRPDIGCAIAGEVSVAHVVHHDENDVRLRNRLARCGLGTCRCVVRCRSDHQHRDGDDSGLYSVRHAETSRWMTGPSTFMAERQFGNGRAS